MRGLFVVNKSPRAVANFVPLCARPISNQNDWLSIASSRVNSTEMKAARSPHFEAVGKRRRASAGAEGAQRGAPAGAFSIAPPQAGRGTECDRPEALRLRRLRRITSGIVTEWAETRGGSWLLVVGCDCAAPGATRLEPAPKGTHKKFAVLNTVLIF